MKTLLQFFLLLIIVGCEQHDNPQIFGAWTSLAEPKNPTDIGDRILFQKPDSLKIYIIENGKVVDSIYGSFHFDENTSKLTTIYDTSEFNFEILELTNNSLHMKRIGTNIIQKLKRLSD